MSPPEPEGQSPEQQSPEQQSPEQRSPEQQEFTPADPMRGFRGVVSATLILEVIVVALALLVVAKLGGGVGSAQGFLVLALVLGLLVTTGLQRFRWAPLLIAGLHLVMLAGFFVFTALGIVGLLFSLVWVAVYLMYRDVARKLAAGTLASQYPADPPEQR